MRRTPGIARHGRGLLLRAAAELRLAVYRRRDDRGLRRQVDRHEPHSAHQPLGAIHRRRVGRQVPEDRNLSENDAGSERRGGASDRTAMPGGADAGASASRPRFACSDTGNPATRLPTRPAATIRPDGSPLAAAARLGFYPSGQAPGRMSLPRSGAPIPPTRESMQGWGTPCREWSSQ